MDNMMEAIQVHLLTIQQLNKLYIWKKMKMVLIIKRRGVVIQYYVDKCRCFFQQIISRCRYEDRKLSKLFFLNLSHGIF